MSALKAPPLLVLIGPTAWRKMNHILAHEPLLLDRTVCLPLYAKWPSFGYFSMYCDIESVRGVEQKSKFSF